MKRLNCEWLCECKEKGTHTHTHSWCRGARNQNPQKSRLVRWQAFFSGLSAGWKSGWWMEVCKKRQTTLPLFFFSIFFFLPSVCLFWVCHFCGLPRTFISSAHCSLVPRPFGMAFAPQEVAARHLARLFDLRQQAKQH